MSSKEQYNLPSDSEDSDVDFKPSDEESLPSEEESDGSVQEQGLEDEEQDIMPTGKRKRKQTKHRTKIKKKNLDNELASSRKSEETEEVKKLTAEEEKKKADSLWNDFMKGCTPPARKTSSISDPKREVTETKSIPTNSHVIEKENKAVISEIFEFAGEKVKVEKEVPASPIGMGSLMSGHGRGRGRGGRGGLASIVGHLGKKNKLSTLEKSKMDWDKFKKEQGIEDQIKIHNKGKEGYLEKQDFLERTDLKQFEIEKQLRTTNRSNR